MINPLDQTVSPPALNAAQSQVGWAHGHRRQFFLRPRFVAIAAVLLVAIAYGAYETYLRFTHDGTRKPKQYAAWLTATLKARLLR